MSRGGTANRRLAPVDRLQYSSLRRGPGRPGTPGGRYSLDGALSARRSPHDFWIHARPLPRATRLGRALRSMVGQSGTAAPRHNRWSGSKPLSFALSRASRVLSVSFRGHRDPHFTLPPSPSLGRERQVVLAPSISPRVGGQPSPVPSFSTLGGLPDTASRRVRRRRSTRRHFTSPPAVFSARSLTANGKRGHPIAGPNVEARLPPGSDCRATVAQSGSLGGQKHRDGPPRPSRGPSPTAWNCGIRFLCQWRRDGELRFDRRRRRSRIGSGVGAPRPMHIEGVEGPGPDSRSKRDRYGRRRTGWCPFRRAARKESDVWPRGV